MPPMPQPCKVNAEKTTKIRFTYKVSDHFHLIKILSARQVSGERASDNANGAAGSKRKWGRFIY
jgi:hypothetical protein